MNPTSTVSEGLLVIIQTGDPCRVTGSAKGTFFYPGLIFKLKSWPSVTPLGTFLVRVFKLCRGTRCFFVALRAQRCPGTKLLSNVYFAIFLIICLDICIFLLSLNKLTPFCFLIS